MDTSIRPAAQDYAPFYARYIELVGPGSIVETLEGQLNGSLTLLAGLNEAQANHAYAPGKWTVKQLVGHVIDTERVFAYRLLRAARGDEATPLAGYDDEAWAATWAVDRLPLSALAAEWQAVRTSTVFLLRHLGEGDWERRVVANGAAFSVRALAYAIAGHELHHRHLLTTRYLG
ncbi:DinB family protein [Deinococcus hohokamensis]|uniref:DinB family protein n=1 Tax=Deinococcus hohokamensis TaxID=309883 RepID=A0ABV9ICU3_9DEIO